MPIKKIRVIRRRSIGTSVLLLILLSFVFNPILLFTNYDSRFNDPSLSVVQERDILIQWGDNVFQNLPYTYSGTFYDDGDPTFAFTNAKIEFTYIPDPTVNYLDTITSDFTKFEEHQPFDETNFTIADGSYRDLNNLQANDDAYGSWNYTGIGEYRATYSFENDLDDSNPSGFVIDETGGTVNVISVIGEHKKVVEMEDTVNGAVVSITNIFTDGVQTSGTVEFWIQGNDVSDTLYIRCLSSGTSAIYLAINSDMVKYYYTAGWHDATGGGLLNDVWYHFKIDFDCATDTYDFYLDGILLDVDIPFDNVVDTIDRIKFETNSTLLNYIFYLDAVGYSWDNDYMVGWNREEYAFFGDYNSTYSFENDLIGAEPSGWVSNNAGDCTTTVIGSLDGHKKVVEIVDGSAVGVASISNEFTQQISGTIEYWIQTNWASALNYLNTYGDSQGVFLAITDNGIKYYDGVWNLIVSAVDDTWYHIRIDFECGSGGYMGLVADTFYIYVDGVKYGAYPFRTVGTYIDTQSFFTHTGTTGYTIYADAIDYSWSPAYSNGRNRLTENHDLLGHYPASHSFPFDDVDEAPEGWTVTNDVTIINSWQDHRKVLQLNRIDANPIIQHPFYTDITSGTVEFYFGSNDVTHLSHFRLRDSTLSGIGINFQNDKIQYYSGGYNDICSASDNTWYHIKIDFETGTGRYKGLSADTFYVTIDGTQYGAYSFWNAVSHVDNMYLICNTGAVYRAYVDGIDLSWDPDYYTGRNLNPTRANLLGQYPASYSFTNELVYATDTEIKYVNTVSGGTAIIEAEYQGHRKVLHYTSGIASNFEHVFGENHTSGTIEFYSKVITSREYWMLHDEDNIDVIFLLIYPTFVRFYYRDGAGSSIYTTYNYIDTTFPHFKVEFDCITNLYSGWCEGELVVWNVPFYNDNDLDSVYKVRHYNSGAFEFYYDAESYSWDDNYLIGDNIHFNNFLGSETLENYDWTYQGYYYGTESFNYYTEDEVYYGTYDFRDELGETGTSIDWITSETGTDSNILAEIIALEDGHQEVMNLSSDGDNGASAYWYHDHTDTTDTEVTIEFWSKYKDNGQGQEVFVLADSIPRTLGYIMFDSNSNWVKLNHGDGMGGSTTTSIGCTADTWHHFKVLFDFTNDDISYWMDGVLEVDEEPFRDDVDASELHQTYWQFQSGGGVSALEVYMDAYGESWDTTSHSGLGYTVGYNKLSQDIEPILEGGYEIDNIHLGDSLEIVNILDSHMNVVNITGSSGMNATFTGNLVSPDQWVDFTFTDGAGDTVGELETNNNVDYSIVNSGWSWGSEYLLGYIVPADSDILAEWDEGDAPPHWSKLDEAKGDMNGDGGNIRARTNTLHDKWNFNSLTIPTGQVVTKIVVYMYICHQSDLQTTTMSYTTSETAEDTYASLTTSFVWRYNTYTGLSLNQADLDGFWVDVKPEWTAGTTGFIDIETVYVDIYITPKIYEHDWYMTWDAVNPISVDYFRYDYRTTIGIECNLSIYNWDTTNWLELQSNTDVNWHTSSYTLTDPYIDGTNQVRVRFQTATHSASFDIEMDQITLDYTDFSFSFDTRSLSIYDTFSQGSGTIEFWVYFIDAPFVDRILFNNDTQIYHNGSYYWRYDTTNVEIVALGITQWVHFKIIWNGNDVDVYVNGTKKIDTFWSDSATTLTRIDFMSFSNYSFYVDAIGFDWDSDYDVGDNINSHGKAVITALENEGWTIDQGVYTSVGISGEYDCHKKILNLTDNSTTNQIIMYDEFSAQASGTIEFYFKSDIALKQLDVNIKSSGGAGIIIYFNGGNINYWDGAGHVITTYVANKWYHIRIDFECGAGGYQGLSADKFFFYLNGIRYGEYSFDTVRDTLNQLWFASKTTHSGYTNYIDSISYSWEESTSYFVGSYNQHCNIEAVIDFIVDIPFEEYERFILHIIAESRHYTNILTNMTFSIYNFNSSSWVEINNSRSTSETLYSYSETDLVNRLDKFFNGSGNVRFKYYGYNCSAFYLNIDLLNTTIYFGQVFEYEKTLKLLGTWKYRFVLDNELGTEYNQTWVYFNVIEQQANFEGISESKYATKWVLTSTATTGYTTTVFSDDLTSGIWGLSDTSDNEIYLNVVPTDDAYVSDDDPDTNYGSSGLLEVTYLTSPFYWQLNSFLKYVYPYFDLNYTSDSTLSFYVNIDVSGYAYVYFTSDFSESTITWNNQPATGTYQTYFTGGSGWETKDIGAPNYYYKLIPKTDIKHHLSICSSEWAGYRPYITHYLSKNYHNTSGEGYAYIQTDETEIIGLKSKVYSQEYSLNGGDYFTVDLQTTSDNAQLKLYNNGVLQKTLNVLIANTEYSRQEVEVYVDSEVIFDQVKITSELADTEYLKLYDIKADHWVFESEADQRSMYVEPFGQNEIIANYGNNSLKIYENNILQVETYVDIGYDLNTYVFESTLPETVFISFYDSNNDYLDFNQFKVYINYTLYEESYTNQRLTNRELFVDEGSTICFEVNDSFNVNIYSASRLAKTFMDITLDVYSLKIKNEKLVPVEYKLKNNDTAITKSGYLFEDEILEYNIATGNYIFEYLKEGESEWENFTFTLTSNCIFVLNRSKICFLSYSNQRGEYLEFNNYKTYINGILLYENVFYEDIGVNISIEIKDRYDISIKNESYVVISRDNYIPVVLTMYSLKVMSQQLCFNHINITRDPNYYKSEYYWSEWIAPNEIIKFNLFAGYYKINLTNNEAGSSSYYSYTLSGDDILLIGSNNTIYNVLVNIANVNATIGNQITNVQIDLTNQNSNINNSIINVDINLGNINSTLGNMLVNLDVDITNMANNISTLYVFTNNSFINLNNAMNTSFIYMENNIISINQSISNLVIGVSNDIYLINGTISTMITQLETNLLLMNVSIDTALFDLGTTLNLIGSNITSNYILLNNSIYLNNLNINDSRIAIINNLLLINNTMSSLISEVYSAVYLINNSIYTAVVDLGTYLSLMNNTIYGNLSIVLEMNEFLTELYQMTMFSDLLNWTNIGLNTSLITSQIDAWTFINNYVNQSIEVHLRYQDLIEKIVISADDSIEQYLPNKDVEYNLWSIVDGEYVDEWKDLDPDNKTVNFGFFEEEIPIDPTPIATTYFTLFIALIFFVIMSLGILKLYYSLKERRTPIPPEVLRYMNKKSKKKIDGVVDNRI